MAMDSEAPSTDPMPLTAHIFGMTEERFAFRSIFIPVGKSIPIKNPKGPIRKKDIISRMIKGAPKKRPKSCFKNRASAIAIRPVAMAANCSRVDGSRVGQTSHVQDPIPAPIRRENNRIAAEYAGRPKKRIKF